MALSTKQLIRSIPNEPDTKNARYVRVTSVKRNSPYDLVFTTTTRIPGDFARKHKIWIKDLDQKDILSSKAIYISCDCDRWQYMWEKVCADKGASSIRYSNGEPPKEKNPSGKLGACKHIFRCLATLAESSSSRR